MHHVAVDGGPFGRTQRVDRAHVAQHAPPDVVDVVEINVIALGQAIRITPPPPDRDAGVAEVGNLVVGNAVVGGMPDPYADGTGEDMPPVADDVVVERDVMRTLILLAPYAGLAEAHAAGAQVMDVGPLDTAVATASAKPHAIGPRVCHLAAVDVDVLGAVDHHDSLDRRRRLRRFKATLGHGVARVAKGKPFQPDVAHEDTVRGVAFENDEFVEHRRNRLRRGGVFARAGLVVQHAVPRQKPLAGLVQRREEVLEVEARAGAKRVPALHALAGGDYGVAGNVYAVQVAARVVPLVVGNENNVRELVLAQGRERLDGVGVGRDGLARLPGHAPAPLVEDLLRDVDHVVIELVRRPGADSPFAVDVELLEIPLTRGDVGKPHGPDPVRAGLEPVDPPSAGDDGLFAGVGGVGNVVRVGGRVPRLEHDGFCDRVRPPANLNLRALRGTVRIAATNLVTRTHNGGKRLLERARIGVIPVGRNEKRAPGRRGVNDGGGEQKASEEERMGHGNLLLVG